MDNNVTELVDLFTVEVSGVKRPATGRPFLIIKSNPLEDTMNQEDLQNDIQEESVIEDEKPDNNDSVVDKKCKPKKTIKSEEGFVRQMAIVHKAMGEFLANYGEDIKTKAARAVPVNPGDETGTEDYGYPVPMKDETNKADELRIALSAALTPLLGQLNETVKQLDVRLAKIEDVVKPKNDKFPPDKTELEQPAEKAVSSEECEEEKPKKDESDITKSMDSILGPHFQTLGAKLDRLVDVLEKPASNRTGLVPSEVSKSNNDVHQTLRNQLEQLTKRR